MVGQEEINALAGRMRDGIASAYGVKAQSLRDALHEAKRHLPYKVRVEAERVVHAEHMLGHPKLARRVDLTHLGAAEEVLKRHLKTVDRAAARRNAVLNWAALSGFYILIVFGGVVWWAASTGRF